MSILSEQHCRNGESLQKKNTHYKKASLNVNINRVVKYLNWRALNLIFYQPINQSTIVWISKEKISHFNSWQLEEIRRWTFELFFFFLSVGYLILTQWNFRFLFFFLSFHWQINLNNLDFAFGNLSIYQAKK